MSADGMRGPIVLREKPHTDLVDRPAYAIPEDATREDFEQVATWVRFHGGEVKYVDAEGLLIASRYPEDDDYESRVYHEWVGADTLLTFNAEHNEFGTFGHLMAEHYLVDAWTGELIDDESGLDETGGA